MNTERQRKLILVHSSFLILCLGLKAVHAGQLVEGGPELPAIGVRELGVGEYVRIEDGGQLRSCAPSPVERNVVDLSPVFLIG